MPLCCGGGQDDIIGTSVDNPKNDPNEGGRCSYCFKYNAEVLRCGGCRNAYYCDRVCQKKHWKHHKKTCQTNHFGLDYISKMSNNEKNSFDYVIKNTPAKDLVKLKKFEGVKYDGKFRILTIGYIDLADFIETFATLPPNNSLSSIEVHMVDSSPLVCTRTAICLWMLQKMIGYYMKQEMKEYAITRQLLLFVWYSMALTHAHTTMLEGTLRRLMKEGDMTYMDQKELLFVRWGDGNIKEVVQFVCHEMLRCKWSLEEFDNAKWNVRGKPNEREFDKHLSDTHKIDVMTHQFIWDGVFNPASIPTTEKALNKSIPEDVNRTFLYPLGGGKFVFAIPPVTTPLLGWKYDEINALNKTKSLYEAFADLLLQKVDTCVQSLALFSKAGKPVSITLSKQRIERISKYPLLLNGFDRVCTGNLIDQMKGDADMLINHVTSLLNKKNPHSALVMESQLWGSVCKDACKKKGIKLIMEDLSNQAGITHEIISDFIFVANVGGE